LRKLLQAGKLTRVGNPEKAKYQAVK